MILNKTRWRSSLMPNSLDANGLQIKSTTEIVESLSSAFRAIYGQDINIESNTPDGQLIQILSQAIQDGLELLQEIYNSFDPDYAIGRTLDERCAINGIQRRSGTYTYVPVNVTVDRSVTLNGIDTVSEEEAYTVSDNQNNQFVLSTTSNLTAGTTSLSFRAKQIGQVEVLPNTITNPVTIVLGVSSINNASGASSVGINEETDAQLRARRRISVSLTSKGYTDGLKSALLNINDVQNVNVYDNRTDVTDSDGIPPHSIWVIVEGGTNDEIGRVMNSKVSGGVGMKGSQTVWVTQEDGYSDEYRFDRPVNQTLSVKVNITPIGDTQIDQNYIKQQVASYFSFSPNQTVDSSSIVCYITSIQSNISCAVEVSADGTNWGLIATPSSKQNRFVITTDSITITVN